MKPLLVSFRGLNSEFPMSIPTFHMWSAPPGFIMPFVVFVMTLVAWFATFVNIVISCISGHHCAITSKHGVQHISQWFNKDVAI